MSEDSIYGVEVDYSTTANPSLGPTTGRIGNAPASSQGAKVVAGYDANTLLAPFRLDAGGNLRTAPSTPSGGSVFVYNGQVPPTTAVSQYGQQIMALQPLPTPVYLPLTLDGTASLATHLKSKPTWRYIVPTTAGGASKSMFSIINNSASLILRIQQCNVQTPYTYTTGNTIIGLTQQANRSVVMLHEMRRITGQTAGASTSTIAPGFADNNDALDSGIVAMSNATISGAASAPFHRADANSPSGLPWYVRNDPNQKTLVLRPKEGMSITTISDTSSYSFDLEVVITLCAA